MDGDEVPSKLEDEHISMSEKAMILGLEKIIEELKRVNENIDFNNSNIANLREEVNNLREEYNETQNDAERTFAFIRSSTAKSSRHLETISQILVITFVANIIGVLWLLSII